MVDQFTRIAQVQATKTASPVPLNVMVELSARCPQLCPMCPLQGSDERMARAEGFMSANLFRKIIDQFRDTPPDVLRLHYSGESTAHPEFAALALYAREALPRTWLQMNTGGLLWTTKERRQSWLRAGIDKLTFSVEPNRFLQDGVDREGKPFDRIKVGRGEVDVAARQNFVIHPYRAGALWDVVVPQVVAAARELAELKRSTKLEDKWSKRTQLSVQHLITIEQPIINTQGGPTTWEIEFSRAFWAQFGVETQSVPVASIAGQVNNESMRNPNCKRAPMGKCREVYTNFVISWDGKVAPCCTDHAFRLLPGINLNDMSIEDAWRHPDIAGLRDLHRVDGDIPAQCVTCLRSL